MKSDTSRKRIEISVEVYEDDIISYGMMGTYYSPSFKIPSPERLAKIGEDAVDIADKIAKELHDKWCE